MTRIRHTKTTAPVVPYPWASVLSPAQFVFLKSMARVLRDFDAVTFHSRSDQVRAAWMLKKGFIAETWFGECSCGDCPEGTCRRGYVLNDVGRAVVGLPVEAATPAVLTATAGDDDHER